jgi:GNAT superfamily N-acetyltransferase
MRLRVVPLDPTLHDRGAFSCGNHQVDTYLRTTAAQAAKYFKAATFVLLQTDAEHLIVGFYTLAPYEYRDDEMDEVTVKALKVQHLGRVPMILLGQLGIATAYQGMGLGRFLLKDALHRALAAAHEIGGTAVITDPYDDRARTFYAKYGFQVLHEQPFLRMILPMRTLAQSIIKAKAESLITQRGEKTKK